MIAALDHPAPPPTTPASSIAATPPATPITDTRREGMLHRAVRDAALAPLRAVLIVHPESVHDVDRPHRTALHLAADQGHATLAVHLLDARADPNARGRQGFTPADCAKYLATRNAERAPGCLCTLAVLYTLHAERSRADEGADPANFILVHQRCAEAARRMALTVPWLDEPWASATAPPGKATSTCRFGRHRSTCPRHRAVLSRPRPVAPYPRPLYTPGSCRGAQRRTYLARRRRLHSMQACQSAAPADHAHLRRHARDAQHDRRVPQHADRDALPIEVTSIPYRRRSLSLPPRLAWLLTSPYAPSLSRAPRNATPPTAPTQGGCPMPAEGTATFAFGRDPDSATPAGDKAAPDAAQSAA